MRQFHRFALSRPHDRKMRLLRRNTALLRIITVCAILLTYCVLCAPVNADPMVSVWLYNSQGVLVLSPTATYDSNDGCVYDATGTLIGSVPPPTEHDPHIYNLAGSQIGEIESAG